MAERVYTSEFCEVGSDIAPACNRLAAHGWEVVSVVAESKYGFIIVAKRGVSPKDSSEKKAEV